MCGELSLIKAEANSPVKDHICKKCKSQYELKSKNGPLGNKINDVIEEIKKNKKTVKRNEYNEDYER